MSDTRAERRTDEQRIDIPLPHGGHVAVIVHYHYGWTMPIVGPPKPPKGPFLQVPVGEGGVVAIDVEITPAG
ncbi:hypothetical protein DWG18_04210 [Lysobacter sp. TY2-98]|uniref:hypothetical protein n=1 Tax=Lysobacter sp. TY2-98 TaxID=2290922 RepID=UPI000E20A360|nr:hypothetical protein [Lysobacter sp. TY2-98]AXK71571.1 hypothetical protein DWG18_04210 [Lysobacter sp. TY2-98]